MAVYVVTATTILMDDTWDSGGTAPGDPGTQTVAGDLDDTTINLSAFASTGVDIAYTVDQVEFTNMASGGFRAFLPGLTESGELTIPFHADQAATTGLRALFVTATGNSLGVTRPGDSPIYFDVKATAAARGTSNPSFVFAANVAGASWATGGVGDKAVSEVTLRPTGAFAILTS